MEEDVRYRCVKQHLIDGFATALGIIERMSTRGVRIRTGMNMVDRS